VENHTGGKKRESGQVIVLREIHKGTLGFGPEVRLAGGGWSYGMYGTKTILPAWGAGRRMSALPKRSHKRSDQKISLRNYILYAGLLEEQTGDR